MAFWGGFRPREISNLRAGDLVPAAGGGAWLRSRSRADSVALPEIMVLQLRHYAMLRVERAGPLEADAAVIAQLKSAEPVTAAAAWHILKDWTVAYAAEDGEPVSTRAIREAFKQLAGADAAAYIRAVERQAAGRRRPRLLAPFEAISAQQVAEDLVKKMAGAATAVPQP